MNNSLVTFNKKFIYSDISFVYVKLIRLRFSVRNTKESDCDDK